MLLPDTNGTVWIGTLGGGLLYFADGRFSRVTSDHGLPDNSVTQLLEDGDGDLWGGTHAGIFRAAKSDLLAAASGQASRIPCPVYGRLDGLPSEECSGWFQPSCWRSRDGILWFATGKGLARLDPREVVVNQRPPPVVIEELRVDGSLREFTASASASAPRAPASGTEGHSDTLRIEPGRHYVEFRFTGLNFTAPGKVRFRWKLEGVEREWREGGNQRVVGYGPLLPGKYRFYVTASNNDGYWNQTGATLAFMVLPHVWETVWFKLVMTGAIFLALALALVSVLRRRHRMQLARLERQRAMEQERARIAQDLHDDLGTSLTQIGMLSSLISRATPTATQVQQLAQQIRSTSRTMVTALNDIVWAVNPKNDSLNELVGYLGDFAERFFSAGPLRCRLEIPADLPEHPLPSELRHGLFLAFKEALNNAAKHSGADKLWVRVALNEGCLSILVEDNGKGLDPKALATTRGNGLRNMRQRLERLGGTCTPTARPEGGPIVQFRLPLTGNDGE
jgi:signal transduction histidine kinase